MSMIADQYHQKLAEAEQMKGTAVKHLTEEIKSKIAELNAFGFTYRLVDASVNRADNRANVNGTTNRATQPAVARQRKKPEGPCVVCGFATVPAHDARAHPRKLPKEPFTAEQLAERKMVIARAVELSGVCVTRD